MFNFFKIKTKEKEKEKKPYDPVFVSNSRLFTHEIIHRKELHF